MPHAILRYAGGRNIGISRLNQKLGLKAGVNGILIGNYLTTKGIAKNEDLDMIKELKLTLIE